MARAYSQLNKAVRALPTCKKPVGDGAKRTRGFIIRTLTDMKATKSDAQRDWYVIKIHFPTGCCVDLFLWR